MSFLEETSLRLNKTKISSKKTVETMEEEIKNFINVLVLVLASLIYCYFIPNKISKGSLRLVSLLPVIILFTLLPLKLSSVYLSGYTGFLISWLASFKLLLFAFDQGPLSSNSSLSLPRFISFACLPIKSKTSSSPRTGKGSSQISLNSIIKISLLAGIFQIYHFKDELHPTLFLLLYCCAIYFSLEITLVIATSAAQIFLGLELEPPFDQPHLSTSLQDFWGKRWNLMVTSILHATVYYPVRKISSRWIRRECALTFAVVATFVVSGLMHELMFFYLCRLPPTWEVMWFFVLHGVCLAVEIMVKKSLNGRWQLHQVVSTPLTIGFVVVTSIYMFFPQLLRGGVDVKAAKEVNLVLDFLKEGGQNVVDSVAKIFYPIQ